VNALESTIMARSRPLVLEQLEDHTAPAVLSVPAAPYPPLETDLPPPPVQTFVTGAVGPDARTDGRLLEVVDGQQFHFILSASDTGAPWEPGVRMTISDPAGHVVFTLTAAQGTTWSDDVFLNAGPYNVSFGATESGSVPAPIGFDLSGWGLWGWGWLGPQVRDTTQQPLEPSAAAALPAPASFFFLPANATDLSAAVTSRGPSFQVSGDQGGVGPHVASAAVLPVPPAVQRPVLNGSLAGAGGGSNADVGQGLPLATPLPAVGVPVAVSRAAGVIQLASAPVEPSPDRGATSAESEEGTVAQPQPVIAELAGATESLPTAGADRADHARLFWALGLGAVVLSALALPPRWCAVLVPERLRIAVRKRRELMTTA
jgi:hypothetical protein